MEKRKIEIEKLLHWAFRDELPKRQTSSAEGIWDRLQQYGYLGGVDADPGHGAAQRYPHFGLPHPDAEKIEKAVTELADASIDWATESEAIMGGLIALADPRPLHARPKKKQTTIRYNNRHADKIGWREEKLPPARDIIMVRTLRCAALVAGHSRKGTRPEIETPRPYWIEAERGPRNRPKLVGECRGKDLYTTGSYTPLQWMPSPISVAEDRADYLAWWRGLAHLAATLDLDAHEALPPEAPQYPWNEPGAEHRVFADQTAAPRGMLPLKPRREPAGAPVPRRKEMLTMKHLGRE